MSSLLCQQGLQKPQTRAAAQHPSSQFRASNPQLRGNTLHAVSSVAPTRPADNVSSIASTANSYVKHLVRLRTNKEYRQETGSVLLVGSSVIQESVTAAPRESPLNVKMLFALEGAPLPDVYAQNVLRVNETVFRKITGLQSVLGVGAAAEVDIPDQAQLSGMAPGTLRRLLVLEGVQDPGNMGTLLRSALALGWQAVYLLPGCCDPFNDKAVRASRGAAFRLPIAQGGWQDLDEIVAHHGLTAIAAQPHAEHLDADGCWADDKFLGAHPDVPPRPATATRSRCWDPLVAELRAGLDATSICLVLGSEGQGLSEETLGRCRLLGIPMSGEMESLNVGVAGAILMFAFSQSMPMLLSMML